jgi:hypothetical protein
MFPDSTHPYLGDMPLPLESRWNRPRLILLKIYAPQSTVAATF